MIVQCRVERPPDPPEENTMTQAVEVHENITGSQADS